MTGKRKEFHVLASVEQALKAVSTFDVKPRIEKIALEELDGRVLAENVFSKVDVPAFDRASMDGFAVIAEDTYGAREDIPVKLKLTGSVSAGELPRNEVKRGSAVEVSTGAVMPKGANAVAMVEYAEVKKGEVLIKKVVSQSENVMHAGSDIMVGELVLRRGTKLGSREIGVLAAIGVSKAQVYKPPAVGIISTGNELLKPGMKLRQGKVYDTNSYALGSAVQECGARAKYFGIVIDNLGKMKAVLQKASRECDLVLASGSTSAGAGDVMYKIIEDEGELLIHGINIKPGKPTIIGLYRQKPFFGLPGYPTSCLTIFNVFAAPLIRKMSGIKETEAPSIKARLAVEVKSEHRRRLLPVGVVRELAYPVNKGSGAITSLSEADGYFEIPENVEYLAAGEEVDVRIFGKILPPGLLFTGSHCLGMDILSELLAGMGVTMRIINTGSSGGFSAMRRRIADLAGVHLYHDSGVYNLPFIKEFKLTDVVLVKGYIREQGLISRRKMKSIEEIVEKKLAIVNRNKGSGTRALLDSFLGRYAARHRRNFDDLCRQIKGYNIEAKTHSAVASAVLLGKADAGMAIRPVADFNKLRFLKLSNEEYDFVIAREKLSSREVKLFIQVLKSEEFARRLPRGISVYEKTGEVIVA